MTPDPDLLREAEGGQDEGQDHGHCLGADEDVAAIGPVGKVPADESQDEDGGEPCEANQSQGSAGPGQPVHQPSLGDVLDPGPDE